MPQTYTDAQYAAALRTLDDDAWKDTDQKLVLPRQKTVVPTPDKQGSIQVGNLLHNSARRRGGQPLTHLGPSVVQVLSERGFKDWLIPAKPDTWYLSTDTPRRDRGGERTKQVAQQRIWAPRLGHESRRLEPAQPQALLIYEDYRRIFPSWPEIPPAGLRIAVYPVKQEERGAIITTPNPASLEPGSASMANPPAFLADPGLDLTNPLAQAALGTAGITPKEYAEAARLQNELHNDLLQYDLSPYTTPSVSSSAVFTWDADQAAGTMQQEPSSQDPSLIPHTRSTAGMPFAPDPYAATLTSNRPTPPMHNPVAEHATENQPPRQPGTQAPPPTASTSLSSTGLRKPSGPSR